MEDLNINQFNLLSTALKSLTLDDQSIKSQDRLIAQCCIQEWYYLAYYLVQLFIGKVTIDYQTVENRSNSFKFYLVICAKQLGYNQLAVEVTLQLIDKSNLNQKRRYQLLSLHVNNELPLMISNGNNSSTFYDVYQQKKKLKNRL